MPPKRARGVMRNPLRTPRPLLPRAHESLISRKTGAEVPLTGLSFIDRTILALPRRRFEIRRGSTVTLREVLRITGMKLERFHLCSNETCVGSAVRGVSISWY
jgi:hypothetical protein